MRTIQISTDTFAAIWKAQRSGESTEEAILRRLLGVRQDSQIESGRTSGLSVDAGGTSIGFKDPRYDVEVPAGFKIFRTYRGKDYSAVARNGYWYSEMLNASFSTLNGLSEAIGIQHENAWANWYYVDDNGEKLSLSTKRNPSKIVKRSVVIHPFVGSK